jgi:hypothetical protein
MKSIRLFLFFALAVQFVSSGFAESKNRDEERMDMLTAAFHAYAAKNGVYPTGTNWEIVRQLTDPYHGIKFEAKKMDLEGNLLDGSGQPYLFLFSRDGWVSIIAYERSGNEITRCVLIPPVQQTSVRKTTDTSKN